MKQPTQSHEADAQHSTDTATVAYSGEALLFDVGSLCEHFSHLVDGRKARGKRYSLVTMLMLMIIAKLCGQDTPEAMAEMYFEQQAAAQSAPQRCIDGKQIRGTELVAG